MSDIDIARIDQAAATIQTLAVVYGVTIPAEHNTNAAIAAEASKIARDSRPVPAVVPTSATKVAAAVKKTATDRILARESQAVAEEIARQARLAATRVLFDLRTTVVAAVAESFAADLTTFGRLLDTAPLDVTSETSPDDAAAHVELLKVSEALTRAAGARLQLAEVDGEETRGHAAAWFVLAPRDDVLLSEIRATLEAGVPTDLAGWVRVHHIGADIAGPDQAEQRAARFTNALWHAGHATPDGGMQERTYADALALVPGGAA